MTAALTLLALLLTPASGPVPGYLEAMDRVQRGEVRAGADALAAFAVGRPEDPLAADALWDAARLYLDRLNDPAAALSMLDRLVAQYPGGRQADRARAELAWLTARRARNPFSAQIWARKCSASSATSSRRSRSGGQWMGTTFSRK